MKFLESSALGLSCWSGSRRCCQLKYTRNARSSCARMAFSNLKGFLNIRYEIFWTPLKSLSPNLYSQLVHAYFSLFLQRKISIAGDLAVKLYYEEFFDI